MSAYEERLKKLRSKYGENGEADTSSAPKAIEESSYSKRKNALMEKYKPQADVTVDDAFINTFIQDANKFLSSAESDFKNVGWGNAATTYETRLSAWKDLDTRRRTVSNWLYYNKNNIDAETYKSLSDIIKGFGSSAPDILDAYKKSKDYYSRWETEEDYNADLRAYSYQQKYEGKSLDDLESALKELEDGEEKDWLESYKGVVYHDEMLKYDTDKASKELPALEQILSSYRKAAEYYDKYQANPEAYSGSNYDFLRDWVNMYNDYQQKFGSQEDLEKKIHDTRLNLNNAKRIQKRADFESVADLSSMNYDPEFAQRAEYASTKSNAFLSGLTSRYGLGYDDLTYEYINGKDNGMRSKIINAAIATHKDAATYDTDAWTIYNHMTDDQIATYNYHYSVNGKKAAEEYLDSIRELLNYQEAIDTFAKYEGDTVMEMLYSITAGVDQFESGIENLFSSKDYITPSATQMTSSMIREDLSDIDLKWYNFKEGKWDDAKIAGNSLGQGIYDLGTTTANMAPSIMTSTVVGLINPALGAAAGNILMGASAAGNAYQEALNLGYDKGQARAYSTLVGASEVGLQYLLGGIGKLGGKLSGKAATTLASKFDSAYARLAVKYGMNMLSEGAEEYLQEILTPVFKNLALGTDEEFELITEDAIYSFLLGALSSGFMETTGISSENGKSLIGTLIDMSSKNPENIKAATMYGDVQQELIDEGLASPIDSESYKTAEMFKRKTDKGKSMTGYEIRQLVDANEAQFVIENLANRLTELGETGNVSAIAVALAKQAAGKKLTKAEQQLISGSKYGQRVANELNTDNINSGEYSSAWAENISTERINAAEYSRLVEAAQLPQETAEVTGEQVATEVPKAVQAVQVAPVEVPTANDQQVTGKLTGKKSLQATEESSGSEGNTVTLEDASKKYGAQAQAMIHTYTAGQDVAKYDKAYQAAYDMGKSGVSYDYVKDSQSASYLTDAQKELAYEAGKAASSTEAQAQDTKNKNAANGKTGRRKGVVKGEGVTIADLKKTFNDTQGKAYKYLSTVAEVTGIDIVLYRSEAGEDGKFQGAQGRYSRSEPGTIYIDLNAGISNINSVDDLAKYAMLRTFAHEFTHFIENWNPIQYNELRKVVFDTITERGENANDLIEEKQAHNPGMSYEKASREVVAEAMTDILPDANFVQDLAENHKTIFQKLLEKLKEFVDNLRDYFNSIGYNSSKEANALKDQVGEAVKYLDSIVKLFDQVAVQAVENYQLTVAVEESTGEAAVVETKVETTVEESVTEVENTTSAVDETQDVPFDKKTDAYFKRTSRVVVFEFEGQKFVSDGKLLVSASDAGIAYAKAEFKANEMTLPNIIQKAFGNATTLLTEAPMEAKSGGLTIYEFTDGEKKLRFDKKLFSFIDGGLLYYTDYNGGSIIKSVNEDGRVKGYLLGMRINDKTSNLTDKKPSNLKSFSKKMQALIDAQTVTKPVESVTKAADTVTDAPKKVSKQAENETYDPNDPYVRFAGLMGRRARFEHEGVIYRVVKAGTDNSMWQAHIDSADVSASGVYVTNSRGLHYTSELYENRDDALNDIIETARASKLLDEKPAETTNNVEEVTENGENADNRAAVQQPVTDGRGAAQVLDGVPAEDVPGDGGRGDTVADAGERGQQIERHGDRPDTQRPGSGSGEGSSQSGDLRGTDRVTAEEPTAQPAEEVQHLHEEVVEQIAQQSTEKPKGRNFVIGDSLDLPNGEKARYKANVEAIRLVKKLEAEGRYATEAEQVILSKYVGWGGLANAFDQRKAEWSKEFAELKDLLTDEEYSSARSSTLNAHYTDISVIKAMYDGLKQLGFTGGRMMEPSSGVGNFVGAMPSDMAANVRSWTMVELDGITGLIAKYLYPNADVRIQGFEKSNIPDNFMDVAISNVPFGNYAIADKKYPKKVTSAIHNYFFAKSLDKVRPGGIVMFITSSYTMNSSDSTVRRYIMQKADLLGAIRLPDSAFKGNAGTEVVTDILVLKKRAANTTYAGEDFLEAPYKYINGYNGAYINSYFENHPEMVLGTPSMEGGMYRGSSLTYKAFTDRGSLADQIREAFKNIQGKMEYPAKQSPEKTNFAAERAGKKTKNNGLVVKDGKVYQNKNGELQEVTVAKGAAERITGMLEIRDAAKELITYQQQGLKDSEIKKARQKLNKVYDAFVKKYGFINSQANRSAIKADPDSYSILALENWNPETKKAVKSDIFSKNTIAPNRTVTAAKDVAEGLIVSVNQTGGVDAALIAKLTGKTEADVTRELLDSRSVFKNRDGGLETAEVYLSGNVRAKLRDAEALAHMDSDYQKNVEALKTVMPEDVSYQDIFVNPGTPWIPNSVYSDFAAYMLGTSNSEWSQAVDVTRNNETGNFTVELKNRYLKSNSYNTQKWGTSRRTFLDLFDAMLNSKSVVVKYKDADGKSVVDQDATAAANEKVEAIQKEFQEWLWKDEGRRTELATLYNETFNSVVTPKYNGDNLTVNGANAMKPLRPHQCDAVQRVISSGGNTLLAHKVGAGKTYEMAAAAMKLKELGLVKKPLFAVPKSLVAQWGNEFMDFFPTAKLLVAEAGDFTATNRKIFANRIANGDYDAVIVSYEQFEKLPISADFARELYQEQIDSIIAAIEEAKAEKGGKSLSVKDLEKKRKSLQTKIEKLTDIAKDEDNIEFEQLGVDSIFVDEAHNFKNLFYTTSMTNVSGLGNKDGSKRAFDLYTKVRYLQKLNGGRGIVFATATPVMNSMSEMYIMQKYLQPDLLDQLGLSTFDAWAKQFGEVVNGVEIKPSGQGYRVKQSFSRFKNMSELQLLFRNFADVLTDIPGLKIPKMKGGKVNVVVCEPGQFQQDYMKELEKRADNIKNVDPSEDNMLKITSDGRKISYTQRMIDPSLPYEEGCKIYRCADNVVRVYQESSANKGTQLIFCDMATPKGKSKASDTQTEEMETDMESARLYDDIKARLMKGGIPAKEIAFIHEADTDAKKKKLFADVNDGKVRVLIGSTGKMGVGMNAQKRIVAIHHLDAPWRPGDVEQRNGRAYRQGNINEEVENFTYVTEGSFDARLWDILDRKQNFINQVMNGENVGRETEDTGEVTLSAAEVKALASGSPLIMEQVQLDTDIKKLESLRRAHRSAVSNAVARMEKDKGRIATLEKMIENGKADTAARVDTYSEGKFSITIGKQKFTEKKDAGTALMAEATAKANEDGYTAIAKFAGFELRVIKTHEGIKGLISGKQSYSFNTYPGNTTYMINHLVARVEEISEAVTEWEHELVQTKKDMAEQEKLITQPFAKQAELDQKRARYNEVMEILNPKEEQSLDSVDEDSVQEQSRSYLGDEDIRDDIFYPKDPADAHAFIRSYANKTSGLKDGEIANIIVFTKNDAYFVKASGYLKGDIESVLPILGNEDVVVQTIKEFGYGVDKSTEALDTWFETVRTDTGRDGWHHTGVETTGAAGQTDDLDDGESGSNSLGYYRENYGYNSWEELREAVESGAMVMNESGDLISFEQYQQRTNTLTDREVLALAASQVKVSDMTAAEKDALDIFQQRLSKLEALQTERAEQGRLYKEQQFGAKVDRAKAAETLNRMHVLDGQIQKASAEVLTVEEKTVLKRVLQKARTVVEQQERQHGQEILKRWRDRRNNADAIKKYRDRLRGDVDELTNWVLHPDNKNVVKHIPDALKNTVIPFLSSINFMSKRSLAGGNHTQADKALMEQTRRLAKVMENSVDIDEMYSNYTDLPPDFLRNLRSFMDTAQEIIDSNSGDFIINQMTAEELQKLSKVVRTLKKYIMTMNRFHVNSMFKHVYEAGENSIDFLAELKPAENTGAVSQFLLWQQMRPAYAFERFGDGGQAIYDGLRRGQATLAFNTKKIMEFSEKAYTTAEVRAWENQVKTIRIGPGKTVQMRVSQIMSLYELNKREQAKGHILGEGIRVATFKNGKQKISDVGQRLTPGELNLILRELTPRQKEVADNLQQFMEKQGGEWGNYVTVARFGEKQFGEKNYFPINSDGRHLQVDADEKPGASALYALLNMSFTKQTQEKAKNRIIVYSIFDVFSNHMASMAQYNAFALPVVDALKWFNYQRVYIDENGSKTILGSVREQMDRAFGVPEENRPGSGRRGYAQNFVINIVKALNGTEAQGTAYDSWGLQTLHHYNRAQVAYNFRVVVQQPLAITRAAQLLDYSSILKGMKLQPAAIQKNIQEMQKYSGIAAWKSLGFYDVNISRGLTSIIKHDDTVMDKITDVGMWGAEKADLMTWAAIWSASKEEVIRKQKLTPKSEGFYETVTKLFEEVIYKTQVVDSVLTKNEFMRDKGFWARAVGSFMSEPTTTASMLVDAYDKYHMDMQRGMSRQQAWKKNSKMIVRTAYVYGVGALVLAAVQAVADAFRDDDDYQEWYEKWLEAFGGNLVDELMPFNKLPIVSDFYDLAKELLSILGVDTYGNPPQSVFMQWYDSLVKGVEILYDKISGEDTSYTWYGGAYKLLQAASGMTGLPMASATRELVAAWNNIVGAMAPSLKVKTYDPGEKNEIKYAYQDGYLTAEEAIDQLLQQGVVDSENEAYFLVQGWEAGGEYSRYDAIFDAVRNGGDISEPMRELTSHGYKEKDVLSQVKSEIGSWYKNGEITKQQAINMLTKYMDMGSEDITATVNKWSSKVVTGIAFEDIKDEYLAGNITAARAIDMYVTYGGYTKEKATETVNKWRSEKETGIVYDDIKDAFMDGEITQGDAKNMYITYGGYSEAEAGEKVAVLVFVKQHPETDGISYAGVEAYQTYCESRGVPAGTFYDVWKYNSNTDADVDANGKSISGSKKAKVLAYINGQNLTYAQKDSLYYAFGWAASKIYEAPWH